MTLRLHGRAVRGPLQLLRRNENGLTFAYGYALQQSRGLLVSLLDRVGLADSVASQALSISLQERDAEGITDIELRTRDAGSVAVLEAKIGGWPGAAQLSRYARHLRREGRGKPVLVALGVSPHASELWRRRSIGGVRLVLVRWADVLSMVNEARRGAPSGAAEILLQLKQFIQEVIGMQSYDREVLVRDLNVTSASYPLFLQHGLYACQVTERAEPLFFAPCFTGATVSVDNGIGYVSRVYYRHVIAFDEQDAVAEALDAAAELVQRQVEPLKKRKRATEQVEYLKGLSAKWQRGFKFLKRRRRRDTNAVFFLGDPIRLPVPLRKEGKMVPIGFSMTLERLMSAAAGAFKC